MLSRRETWILGFGTVLAAALAACGQQNTGTPTPAVEEKTFALAPASASVKAEFLAGQLQDMKVVERVEQGTGKVVEAPKLHATLKLKNTSTDQTARLVGGKVEYTDKEGKPIPLSEGRQDTSFSLPSYQMDHLDPGKDFSQDIDVPFPSGALKEKRLQTIGLELIYVPTPYRQDTIKIQVSVAQ